MNADAPRMVRDDDVDVADTEEDGVVDVETAATAAAAVNTETYHPFDFAIIMILIRMTLVRCLQ